MKRLFTHVKEFGILLRDTFKSWNARDPFNNSIIISYYTIFSLPGLLVIVITVAGYFYGTEAVTGKVTAEIQSIVGGDAAKDIERIVAKAGASKGSTLASILGIATLLFGATGIFYKTQQILNEIWEVKPKPKQKILKLFKDRLFSFGLILAVGFLLLVSLMLSTLISALSDFIASRLSESLLIIFRVLDVLLSVGIVTLLFATMYKFLPDAKIRWKDVWVGAVVTALLFVLAKFALGLYFGQSNPASTYGAAGTIVLILLWVSYAGMILLFGAEFTQVYAARYGQEIVPKDTSMRTTEIGKAWSDDALAKVHEQTMGKGRKGRPKRTHYGKV